MSKRRGRKRKPNAARRTKTTRAERNPADPGTPELQMKRARLVRGADPALSESPLGILFARGLITEGQHEAGGIYAVLRWSQFGKGHGFISRYGDMVHEHFGISIDDADTDPERDAALAAAYARADGRLRKLGRRAYDETRNVAVFARLPGWFHRLGTPLRAADLRNQALLSDGLDELAKVFVIRAKAA